MACDGLALYERGRSRPRAMKSQKVHVAVLIKLEASNHQGRKGATLFI